MAVRIFDTISSLNLQRFRPLNNTRLSQSVERITTGLRVNKSADDPAGLQISQNLRSDLRVLSRNINHTKDSISLVSASKGALDEVFVTLVRLREVAAQAEAATGITSSIERQGFQLEFDALRDEIDRIGQAAEFSGQKLLDGSLASSITTTSTVDQLITFTNTRDFGVTLSGTSTASVSGSGGPQTGVLNFVASTSIPSSVITGVSVTLTHASSPPQNVNFEVIFDGTTILAERGTGTETVTGSGASNEVTITVDAGSKPSSLTFSFTADVTFITQTSATAQEEFDDTKTIQVDTVTSTDQSFLVQAGLDSTEPSRIDLSKQLDLQKITTASLGLDLLNLTTGGVVTTTESSATTFLGVLTTSQTVSGIKSDAGDTVLSVTVPDDRTVIGVNVTLTFAASRDATTFDIVYEGTTLATATSGSTSPGSITADALGSSNDLTITVTTPSAPPSQTFDFTADVVFLTAVDSPDVTTETPGQFSPIYDSISDAISTITAMRDRATVSLTRLRSVLNNLLATEENLRGGVSAIRDADFALEIAQLTRNQILVSSTNALQGQSNLAVESVFRLLDDFDSLARQGTSSQPQKDLTGNPPPRQGETLKIPSLELGNQVAGFRVQKAIQFLSEKSRSSRLPITDNLEKKSGSTDSKNETLKDIKTSLQELRSAVSGLRTTNFLSTRSAKSLRPKLVQVTSTSKSPVGVFSVKPERTAAGNVLVSDKQDSGLGSLGLSGSFIINGFEVTVESSDTLIDIKNKINFGEDINRNGTLDSAEDFNGNNINETLEVSSSEFGPGVFIIEDLNGNGILDPSEDTNNNDRLDGGTGEIKVSASIQSDRLVLTSLTGGASTIDLKDDNNILLSLGFFQINGKGLPILKEQQVDFSFNPAKDLNRSPQKAKIEVDGQTFTSNTNIFEDAIENTKLDINLASNERARIEVFADTSNAADQIKSFFDNFNESIKKINNALQNPSLFARDPDIQRIRNNLLDNSQQDIRKINQENRAIDKVRANRENDQDIGLESVNNKKNIVQEVALTRTVQAIRDGVTLPFKNIGNDLLGRLTSIGILTENDDTIKVNEAQLKRALTINSETIFDLFNNSETGLLPRLDQELSRVLKTDLGDIDLKQNKISVKSGVPPQVAGKLQSFVSNTNFNNNVQNLIAVV